MTSLYSKAVKSGAFVRSTPTYTGALVKFTDRMSDNTRIVRDDDGVAQKKEDGTYLREKTGKQTRVRYWTLRLPPQQCVEAGIKHGSFVDLDFSVKTGKLVVKPAAEGFRCTHSKQHRPVDVRIPYFEGCPFGEDVNNDVRIADENLTIESAKKSKK